jgi:ferredoxin
MPKVTIVVSPSDDGGTDRREPRIVEVPAGTTLFEAGAKLTAGIDTACVGKGTCGLCRVKILEGAENLNPFTDEERKHLGNVYHLTKVRLSCRSILQGDVSIEVVRPKKPMKRK